MPECVLCHCARYGPLHIVEGRYVCTDCYGRLQRSRGLRRWWLYCRIRRGTRSVRDDA